MRSLPFFFSFDEYALLAVVGGGVALCLTLLAAPLVMLAAGLVLRVRRLTRGERINHLRAALPAACFSKRAQR